MIEEEDKHIGYRPTPPDFVETLASLQGGVVADLATRMMADTAMAVAECGDKRKKGKIVLTIEMAATNNDQLLEITHKLEYKHPTARGNKAEDVTDEQVMFINRVGALSAAPDNQGSFTFEEVN